MTGAFDSAFSAAFDIGDDAVRTLRTHAVAGLLLICSIVGVRHRTIAAGSPMYAIVITGDPQ